MLHDGQAAHDIVARAAIERVVSAQAGEQIVAGVAGEARRELYVLAFTIGKECFVLGEDGQVPGGVHPVRLVSARRGHLLAQALHELVVMRLLPGRG